MHTVSNFFDFIWGFKLSLEIYFHHVDGSVVFERVFFAFLFTFVRVGNGTKFFFNLLLRFFVNDSALFSGTQITMSDVIVFVWIDGVFALGHVHHNLMSNIFAFHFHFNFIHFHGHWHHREVVCVYTLTNGNELFNGFKSNKLHHQFIGAGIKINHIFTLVVGYSTQIGIVFNKHICKWNGTAQIVNHATLNRLSMPIGHQNTGEKCK